MSATHAYLIINDNFCDDIKLSESFFCIHFSISKIRSENTIIYLNSRILASKMLFLDEIRAELDEITLWVPTNASIFVT